MKGTTIKYLLKFVPKEQYADDLLDGKLFMHTAAYYHDQERRHGIGRGDVREGMIFPYVAMYKNTNLPIFCLYAVAEDEAINGHIQIPKKIICDFGCINGYIVLIDYSRFEEALKTCDTGGYALVGSLVQYGIPTKELSSKMMVSKELDNLFIKHPFFAYQKEYRLVIWKSIPPHSHPELIDGVWMNVIGEHDYPSVVYQLGTNLNDFSAKYAVNALYHDDENYYLAL